LAWYEKYPEFKKNDLWLSGESYGGIYVPYMAYNIDQHNTAHLEDDTVFKPLLKGFAVGNGVTNWKFDTTPAFVDMGYWHSLYDTALYDKI
jgi:carboxypeptidase C (cathepsin A)